jgi:hypothetical protein
MNDPAEMNGQSEQRARAVEYQDGEFLIDADLLAKLFELPASDIPVLMRRREITSICERGVEDDDGKFHLTFFYQNRRAQLTTDQMGGVSRQSAIDFGDRPIPEALRRSRESRNKPNRK